MSSWEIWHTDNRGRRIALLDYALGWSLVRNANTVGQFSLPLPYNINTKLFTEDSIIEFWRATTGILKPEFVGFVRKQDFSETEQGDKIFTVGGPDQNYLLSGRIVAYNAGNSYTSKSGSADNLMRAIVRENLGALCTDTSRDLSSIGLSVEADLSLGQSIDLGFSRKNLLDTLQKMADTSAQKGTPLYFRLSPGWAADGTITFRFEVVKNWLGNDRVDTGSPVVFGDEWGNLTEATLSYDYSDEVTYVYAGGPGEDDFRYVYPLGDTARLGASPWNRRESFVDASNLTKLEVQSKAREALEAGKPTVRFSGTLLEGENSQYGVHWNFGDWVSATFCGRTFMGMVKAIRIDVDANGNESIQARLEV